MMTWMPEPFRHFVVNTLAVALGKLFGKTIPSVGAAWPRGAGPLQLSEAGWGAAAADRGRHVDVRGAGNTS